MDCISVAALGRGGQVGDFYDARSDSFLPVHNLFDSADRLAPFLQVTRNPEAVAVTLTSWVTSDSFTAKARRLDVSRELQLSLLAGLVNPAGASLYLTHEVRAGREGALTLLHTALFREERVNLFDPNLKELMRPEVLEGAGEGATHVVFEVQYGNRTVIVFERDKAESEAEGSGLDPELLKAVQAAITPILEKEPGGGGLGDFVWHRVSVFSDSFERRVDGQKEALSSLEQVLASLRSKSAAPESESGVPIRFSLFPIAVLRMYFGLKSPDLDSGPAQRHPIDESTSVNFVNLFEGMTKRRLELIHLQRLASEFEYAIMEEDQSHLWRHIRDCEEYEAELKTEFREGLLRERRGGTLEEGPPLDAIHAKFLQDLCSPKATEEALRHLSESLLRSASFAKLMLPEGVRFITPSTPLEEVLLSHDGEVYVLFTCGDQRGQVEGARGANWDLNVRLFIALCRDGKRKAEGAQPLYCIQATSPRLEDGSVVSKAIISKYKAGVLVTRDLGTSGIVSLGPTARRTWKAEEGRGKVERSALVKLPCPRSNHPATGPATPCSKESVYWRCSECFAFLEFGFDGHFYCSCGKVPAVEFEYNCGDWATHGLDSTSFDPTSLNTLLEGLQPAKQLNLLLLGETGVGKSTWINGFSNYVTYDSLGAAGGGRDVDVIPTRFSMLDGPNFDNVVEITSGPRDGARLGESGAVGQSRTQSPRSYVFSHGENGLVRLVDTPGVGDTRGIEQDMKNFTKIMDYISGLNEIHGICILMTSNVFRMSVSFQFCLQELLSLLHEDAVRNLVFCFTFARSTLYCPGNTRRTLEIFLREHENKNLPLSPFNNFCVDNESVRFLAALRHGLVYSKEETKDYEESWRRAVAETDRLLQQVATLQPHRTSLTLNLNKTRHLIQELVTHLQEAWRKIDERLRKAEVGSWAQDEGYGTLKKGRRESPSPQGRERKNLVAIWNRLKKSTIIKILTFGGIGATSAAGVLVGKRVGSGWVGQSGGLSGKAAEAPQRKKSEIEWGEEMPRTCSEPLLDAHNFIGRLHADYERENLHHISNLQEKLKAFLETYEKEGKMPLKSFFLDLLRFAEQKKGTVEMAEIIVLIRSICDHPLSDGATGQSILKVSRFGVTSEVSKTWTKFTELSRSWSDEKANKTFKGQKDYSGKDTREFRCFKL